MATDENMMHDLFFKDWNSLFVVLISSIASYLALFAFIRISGKRTLAKLNAFDFVVSVTLGSTLSSMILAKVSITEGLVAVGVIIALQYFLAKTAQRSSTMESVINSSPTLLFYNGHFIEEALAKEVITKDEILAAVRCFRLESLNAVRAVILELNGEMSVVKKEDATFLSSLKAEF